MVNMFEGVLSEDAPARTVESAPPLGQGTKEPGNRATCGKEEGGEDDAPQGSLGQ